MKPKIVTRLANIFAKLAGSADYDPTVVPKTPLEYYANQIPVVPNPTNNDTGKVLTAVGAGDLQYVAPTPYPGVTAEDVVSATEDMSNEQKGDMKNTLGYVTQTQGQIDDSVTLIDTDANKTATISVSYDPTYDEMQLVLCDDWNDTPLIVSDVNTPRRTYDAANKEYVDAQKPLIVTFSGRTGDGDAACDKTWSQIRAAGDNIILQYSTGTVRYRLNAIFTDTSVGGTYLRVDDPTAPSDYYVVISVEITANNVFCEYQEV